MRELIVIALMALSASLAGAAECTPELQWEWEGTIEAPGFPEVCVTPLVLQVTDDNGDGVIGVDDDPDVVFVNCPLTLGTCQLTALDGRTRNQHFQITIPASRGYAMLGADIDLDGIVEIITFEGRRIMLQAFEHDGSGKWTSDILPVTTDYDAIGSADLDQDGVPEIYVAATVYNSDGSLRWQGAGSTGRDTRFRTQITNAVDLDPESPGLELLAGPTLYSADGAILWDRTGELPDGWTGIADFDGDGDPEIVLTGDARVFLLDHQGASLGPEHALTDALGQPAIGDLDGDTMPEVVVNDGVEIQALDWGGAGFEIRWRQPVSDTSRQNGATLYDFDGDGRSEVIYHDQDNWYLYEGDTGAVISTLPFDSGTGVEVPVVANVDDDPAPEILISGCRGGFDGWGAVQVFECSCAVPARRIWNQFAYHGTNVEDDGTIPRFELPSWTAHNSWMAQLPATGGGIPGPTAVAGDDREICPGDPVFLDGSDSVPCGLAGLEYRWLEGATVLCGFSPDPVCEVRPTRTATYTLEVVCPGGGEVCVSSDEVRVTVVPDPLPGPVGNTLRMRKSMPEAIVSTWADLPGPVGAYELVVHPESLGPPEPVAMDAARIKLTAPSGMNPVTDATGLVDPPGRLVFWRVRATSFCTLTPGPTCNGFPAQVPCP